MNNKKNEIYDTVICKNCWRSFSITRGEYEYFTNRGWELPKRCKSCRSMRNSDNLLERAVIALNEEAHHLFKNSLRNLGKELRHWR